MKYVVISPYSRSLRNGKRNPKNYPYWEAIVSHINNKGIKVIQIGSSGETQINGVSEFYKEKSFKELENLVRGSDCLKWISVDNFFHHFCMTLNVPGIVIFGRSDPNIFGHKLNMNIIKDRKYLREDQFGLWESVEFDADVFVDPKVVCNYL